MLYCIVMYVAVLCCAVLYSAVLYNAVLHVVFSGAVLYSDVWRCIVRCFIILTPFL